MNLPILSKNNQNSSQSSFDRQLSYEECNFCSGINLARCMTISVANKYSEQPNFYLNLTQKLLNNLKSPLTIKFEEILKISDHSETLLTLYSKHQQKVETRTMLEYYKYRKFVPLFADVRLGIILHGYYYQTLKIYYNQIKRKLNLTVDLSSSTSFSPSSNLTNSQTFINSKILDQLNSNFKIQQTTGPTTINNFKTQSKALEDLVNYLKINAKFQNLRSLNVQSQWQKIKKTSKQIFRDIVFQDKNHKHSNKNKTNLIINFYSPAGSIKKLNHKKIEPKIIKTQKLVKSKDLKTFNQEKEKDIQICQKLEKIKNQILDQKILQINKGNQKDKLKKKIGHQNKPEQTKPIRFQQSLKPSERRKSLQKIKINTRNQNSTKYQNQRSVTKPKKSQSQSKLKNLSTLQKSQSIKAISNRPLQALITNQRLIIPYNQEKQAIITNLKTKKPIKRRKSLDLTKMKTLLPEIFDNKIDFITKKNDYLTQRYQNMLLQNPNHLMIRTSNVSPVAKKQREDNEQIVLQKSDNIVSIKKKKLQMLRKKMELQKIQKK